MTKPILKVCFVDYLETQTVDTNIITKPLLAQYDIVEDAINPDIAICTMWGNKHLNISVPKIYVTFETYRKHAGLYDMVISSYKALLDTEFQSSNIVTYDFFNDMVANKYSPTITDMHRVAKTKFCAFLYANKYARERVWFCKKLHKYKWVDCLGKVLNNTKMDDSQGRYVSDWAMQQLDIYKEYKFTIAFENKSIDGYVCEKITQPLLVGSIPIYWGARDVGEYFNPDCFINVNDFDSFDDCIEYVKKVDNDPVLYKKYRDAVPILPTSKLHNMTPDIMHAWIVQNVAKITSDTYEPVGCICGIKRICALFDTWWWRKRQRIVYKWQTFLELVKVR